MTQRTLLPAFLLSASLAAHAQKQSATFNLYLQGKPVGKDTFTLQQSAKGAKLTSRFAFKYLAPGVEGMRPATVSVDISDEFHFDPTFLYIDGTSENMDTHFRNSFVPDKTRTEITIADQNYSGSQNSDTSTIGPDLIVLTNFDAGAAQAAFQYALAHPTPNSTFSVLVPGKAQSGGGPGGGGRGGRGARSQAQDHPGIAADEEKATVDARWSRLSDTTGQLDGKPVAVRAYRLATPRTSWTFYADGNNTLLQLDMMPIRAAYIRAGFQLTPTP